MLTINGKPIGFETWALVDIPSTDIWHNELLEVKNLGIGAIEISAPCSRDNVRKSRDALENLQKKCNELGLSILGWHAPVLSSGLSTSEQIKAIKNKCASWNTPNVTIIDWQELTNGQFTTLDKYAHLLKVAVAALTPQTQVYFHVYNNHLEPIKGSFQTELDYLLQHTNHQPLGIQLDTYWLAAAGYLSPERFFREFASLENNCLSIHLGNRTADGKNCALGDPSGKVDCKKWLDIIQNDSRVKNMIIEFMPGALQLPLSVPNSILVNSIQWLKDNGAILTK